TLNMLLAARKAGVKRLVYASSSSIYGDSPVLPKVETMPVNPLSPYALSKYAGECYVRLFFNLYGLETVALRYFNVFGPRQDPHSQYAAVIPSFISGLLNGEQPIIYGDGNQSRDFSYIGDVVRANMLAMEADKSVCGEAYNIACQAQMSVKDLFGELKNIVVAKIGKAKEIMALHEPARQGDVRASMADISKARKNLKYGPAFALRDGLVKTVDYFLGV
ncbi:MAG: NAD-dependent epimerase/dehydratase family protein, partial [Candidatus Omnitrophota bacterium]|nr:NAD-dependent epimerase/dehydratase family protein [Candidatus Omnitrophota bacterium]